MAPSRCGSCRLTSLQAKRSSTLAFKKKIEQRYRARATILGWLAKFLGRLYAFVKFSGWSDVAPRVQRQHRVLLVVFQREPRRKRATHAKFSRTHTLAKTCHFWFCWRCGFFTAKRVQWVAGRCRGIAQSLGGVLKKLEAGRNPKDGGWPSEPNFQVACRHVASADVAHRPERLSRVTVACAFAQFLLTSSAADAGPAIRTSSHKKKPNPKDFPVKQLYFGSGRPTRERQTFSNTSRRTSGNIP